MYGLYGLLLFILLLGAFFFYASYHIRSGVYLKTWSRLPVGRKEVALTFDDGPHPLHTAEVLDVLKRHSVPATFFCIGKEAERQPELMRRLADEGHLVGNHSYCHKGIFPFFTFRRMLVDVERAHKILEESIGQPVTLFRPPFGVTNPTVASVVRRMGYQAVGWSIRSFDTRGEATEKVFRRIVGQIRPGAVILLHDRLPGCAALTERLLEYLEEKGYRVVRVQPLRK